MKKKLFTAYIRKGRKYTPEEFLAHVQMHHTKDDRIMIDGDEIKLGSDRYKTFKFKGLTCVKCGIVGVFFAKEVQPAHEKFNAYHMNLYGINAAGEEILMTKDHIVPRSKGGLNQVSNYQTMCCICNFDKADELETKGCGHI